MRKAESKKQKAEGGKQKAVSADLSHLGALGPPKSMKWREHHEAERYAALPYSPLGIFGPGR